MAKVHGIIFIVSAPSGAGKTSLVKALLEENNIRHLRHSISHTTRPKRPGEVNGEHYHFVSKEEFSAMQKQHAFVETAEIYGNFYGTSKAELEKSVSEGVDLVLDIDQQGAEELTRCFPDKTVRIYILPPSKTILKDRLEKRAQDHPEVIATRFAEAKLEVQKALQTSAQNDLYQYFIINDKFEDALEDLKAIIRAERHKTWRQRELHKELIKELLNITK